MFLDKKKQGGGPLIDIGTHSLDLTLWLMNNYEPHSVMGNVYYKMGSRKNAANAYGPWDPEKFEVEDSAFGFITMKNGATIMLESSRALNTLQVGEAKCMLSGTEGGAEMVNGLRLNGERYSRLYVNEVDLETGKKEGADELEARLWIESVINNTDPIVKPEQALVVTEILEAIYASAASGKPVFFR